MHQEPCCIQTSNLSTTPSSPPSAASEIHKLLSMSFFHKKDKASSTTSTEIPETTDTMIPQTDQTATATETDAPVSTETTLHCTTTGHLMSYPLVKETVDFVEKVPGVETVNEVSKPAVEFVQSQSLLKPIIETADMVGNYTLGLSDSVAPCLKTIAYEDITNTVEAPFIAASDAIQKSTKWTTETVEDSICSPTRQMIKDFRAYYNEHLYDTKGKPLLRSSLDPMMRPVNNYMESVGKAWLPETEPLSGDYSSEIEKSVYLTFDLTKRSIPVVMNKKIEVLISPYTYTVHAIDVFNKNLAKEESGYVVPPMNAAFNSTIDLANEAWDVTMQTFGVYSKPVPALPTEQPSESTVTIAA